MKRFVLLLIFFSCLFFLKVSAVGASDAIAIRIIDNPKNYSPERWYKDNFKSGSPQNIEVDGYRAVRDGNTTYVNTGSVYGHCENDNNKRCSSNTDCGANNCVDINLKTVIFVITFNQGADSQTVDIFGQIIANWAFNNDILDSGYCFKYNQAVNFSEKKACINDRDCSGVEICSSRKAGIVRDVKRLEDMAELRKILDDYKQKNNGKCPGLEAGSFVANKSLSVWPSWQKELGFKLGNVLPLDPINKLSNCFNPFSLDVSIHEYDKETCWNPIAKTFAGSFNGNQFVLPENVRAANLELMAEIKKREANKSDLVRYLYYFFLGNQNPSTTDFNYWLNFFNSHSLDESLLAFVSAPEYVNKQTDISRSYAYSVDKSLNNCDICGYLEKGAISGGELCLTNANLGDGSQPYTGTVNSLPIINCANSVIFSDTTLDLSVSVADHDGDKVNLFFTNYNGANWSSWPSAKRPILKKISDNFWQLHATGFPSQSGEYFVNLSASDGQGTSTKLCSIKYITNPPVIKPISDIRISQGSTISAFKVYATQIGVKNFPLDFKFSVKDNLGNKVVNLYSSLPINFQNGALETSSQYSFLIPAERVVVNPGNYYITLEVSDSIGNVSAKIFRIEVYNDKPVLIRGIKNQELIASSGKVVLDEVLAVKDDINQLPLTAQIIEGVLPVGITDSYSMLGNVLSYVISGNISGGSFPVLLTTTNIKVKIKDVFNQAIDFVYKIIIRNNPPQLNINNCLAITSVRRGSVVNCTISASDPEGNSIKNFKMTGSPGLVIVNNGNKTATISGTASFSSPGKFFINFTATDEFDYVSAPFVWELNVLSYCGDNEKQSPNLEGRGGLLNNGFEQCDGLSGVANDAGFSNINYQYACKTDCTYTGGYCGDNSCNATFESCFNCADCGTNHDNDGDSVGGCSDNCPDTYNPKQEDVDGDKIGDFCDDCYNYAGGCVRLKLEQNGQVFYFAPYVTAKSPQLFYDYDTRYPASSAVAEEYNIVKDKRSNIFGYVNASNNTLGVGIIHDKPKDGSGGNVEFDFSGTDWDNLAVVKVSDDAGQLKKDRLAKEGDWVWDACCTDGGMLEMGGLSTPWTMKIKPKFVSGINQWFIKIPGSLNAGHEIPSLTATATISYEITTP